MESCCHSATQGRPSRSRTRDFRNVVKTIALLPTQYQLPVNVVVNDRDPGVIARNLAFLLIMLTCDESEAVDCILHVWYSARLRPRHMEILQNKVRKQVRDVVDKLATNTSSSPTIHAKTWKYPQGSVRVELTKEQWSWLLLVYTLPLNFNKDVASHQRLSAIFASHRLDLNDQFLAIMVPELRPGHDKYLKDGMMLPFGHSTDDFSIPNP
jgi:hypothetical protein